MTADLSLGDLNAVATVAATRNFRAAAVELGIPPSSLSHAIASIERRLGVRLFNRTTRSVALTEAGSDFLERVRPALHDISAAVEMVNRFRATPAGLLRLNGSEGSVERVLPLVLDFLDAYPDMRVDIASDGRLVDIVATGFDAGLRLAEAVPQDMVAVPVGNDEAFSVVGTPGYFASRPPLAVPGDLFAHACIRTRMASGAIHRWEFEHQGETVVIDPPGRLTLGSHDLSLRAARDGAGLAYVTERAAREDLASGRLLRALASWTPAFPGLCLYYPRQRLPSAGLAAFIAHVRAARARPLDPRKA
ncbi:DNA-binding transcriptional regulator, LysR family [Kaistia soli DSM 19436]|uniref:DNA-binding transcriptional regulator, LysR family n=1 Tax=Kaistia soli DSM 19436 TaxID=1122133 RepID=A0A1M4VZA7_9HYPH|nr:LysR family transcriptional regulator [Kaistia soli]SHE74203.1 DNA-binding transcriptional regulator, LysR family [Kaistia soli DSM 19436]